MGFFDSIKDIFEEVIPIASSIFLPQTAAGLVAKAIQPEVEKAVIPTTLIGEATGVAVTKTGGLRRITIVQTIDPATGKVVKQETFKGAPAVMQSDVAAANRLNRQLRRLNSKQPKKMVKQSLAARLKEEVVESALRHAIHNGNGHHNGGTDNDPIIIKT